jgi:hypothetical protein
MRMIILAVLLLSASAASAQSWSNSGASWGEGWDGSWNATSGGTAAPAGCGEPPSTSLAVWLDGRSIDGAGNTTFANNDPITTWTTLGSIADSPTQATGTAKPTFIANCINGKACARFDGGDRLQATTAANFAFLSNGNDWTAYIVEKISAADPNNRRALWATRSAGGLNIGAVMQYDDRAASSANEKVSAFIGNGTNNVISAVSADGAHPFSVWHTLSGKLADDGGAGVDYTIYVDGASVATAARGAASYSASAPLFALIAGGDATDFITGDIAQLLMYQVSHDDTQRGVVESWINCTYGTMPVTP